MTSTTRKPAAAKKKVTVTVNKKPASPKKKATVPPIEKETVIKAPAEMVWAAISDPETIGAWMDDGSVKVSLKVGGKYAIFGGVTTGKITAVEKPAVLEYTWRQADWEKSVPDTLVRWELKPEGKKTRLLLTHSQFVDRQNRDEHEEGWDVYFLDPMKMWLESQK
jgi:uncharacterized protein YndB with AHSA1/START domain